MLSEINQSEKDKYYVILLIHEVPRTVKSMEIEKRMVVVRGLGRDEWGIV